jgi:hypothetical protein
VKWPAHDGAKFQDVSFENRGSGDRGYQLIVWLADECGLHAGCLCHQPRDRIRRKLSGLEAGDNRQWVPQLGPDQRDPFSAHAPFESGLDSGNSRRIGCKVRMHLSNYGRAEDSMHERM